VFIGGFLLALVGVLSNIAQLQDFPGFKQAYEFMKFVFGSGDRMVSMMGSWPTPVALLIAVLVAFWFHVRRVGDMSRMFDLATQRLHDDIPPREQLAARQDNVEADSLGEFLDRGRNRPTRDAFHALCRFWDVAAASMTTPLPTLHVIDSRTQQPIPYPSVVLPLPDSILDPNLGGEALNRIIRIERGSTLPDAVKGRRTRAQVSEFTLCEPRPRFLTRFRGPDPLTGFIDDYSGMNICARELEIIAQIGPDGSPLPERKLQLPIVAKLEPYGNVMDSCDAMLIETYLFFAACARLDVIDPIDLLRYLPWRRKVNGATYPNWQPILKPDGRAAAFGICALTVFRTTDAKSGRTTYKAILGRRSSRVGTYKHALHVIPSGMTNFRIEGEGHNSDWDFLIDNDSTSPGEGCVKLLPMIEREFLEEIFSQEWTAKLTASSSLKPWTDAVHETCKKYLYGPSGEFNATIHLTGIVLDLLNYRPEICTLILIDAPEWYDNFDPRHGQDDTDKTRQIRLNWEYETRHSGEIHMSNDRNEEIRYVNIFDEQEVANAMPPESSVLSGAAAFHLGVQKAREIIRSRYPNFK